MKNIYHHLIYALLFAIPAYGMEYGLTADIIDVVSAHASKPKKKILRDAATGLLAPYITIETAMNEAGTLFISTAYNNNQYEQKKVEGTATREDASGQTETYTVSCTQYVKSAPIFTKETPIAQHIDEKELRSLLAEVHLAVYEELLQNDQIAKISK
jgi:hypothetical protein